MSDTYKTISRAREISKALLTMLTWTKSAIVNEMGVTFALYQDIMEVDPVAIKIRTPTIEKLKAFIAKHEAILDKEPKPMGVTRSAPTDPFPVIPRKPSPESVGLTPIIKESELIDGDPLAELDRLEAKFAKRGYKLETRIIKIHQ